MNPRTRWARGARRRADGAHRQAPSAAAADASAASEQPRPSRSARKRQALALQELGVRLTLLKPAQLQQLALPEELLAAVLEAQRLRSRAALSRQRQYIGRLMRGLDPEPIARTLSDAGRARNANDKLR